VESVTSGKPLVPKAHSPFLPQAKNINGKDQGTYTPQSQGNLSDKVRSFSGGGGGGYGPNSCKSFKDQSSLYLKTKDLRQRSRVSNVKFHPTALSESSVSADSRGKIDGGSESSLERIHTFNLKVNDSHKSSVASPKSSVQNSPSNTSS
jgi:hypothetical protein